MVRSLIFDYVKVTLSEGVHDIVGIKPLSHGGKWMRNKGSLTFKLFEGEYSMISLRIPDPSMNEI